jgi:pimeloyl-ACP methyl ester carboxylesterase
VVDRPGCGLSDAFNYRDVSVRAHAIEFIKSFMEAVGLQQAQFIGHSMGGYFSICFALQYPERVEKLLLAGAPAGMNHWIPFRLRLLGTKGINSLLLGTVAKPSIKSIVNIYKEILVADVENLSDDFLRHMYYSQILPGRLMSFATLLENVLTLKGLNDNYYVGDKLHQLSVPVRFIWGDKDAFEKPDTGMQKAKRINDCKFEVVENAGHCLWLDQPEQSTKAILSMMDGASPN